MTSDHDDTTPSIDDAVVELAGKLFEMARGGQAAELIGYLDAGAPVDLRNQSGDSLLMLASYYGHVDVVAALLARGADTELANDKGQTPLAGAVFKGFDDVVAALVAGGADPHGGAPTAAATAQMFGREDYQQLW